MHGGSKPRAKVALSRQRSASQLAASLSVPAARLSCRPPAWPRMHARSVGRQQPVPPSSVLVVHALLVTLCAGHVRSAHRDPRPVPSYTPEACMLTTAPSFFALAPTERRMSRQPCIISLIRDGAQDGASVRQT